MLTYRQLHAKKIGPQHPLRVIAHCDVDAAYAQFEQVRLNIPPEKPLAVQQWRGLIAVNYPARKFGITRHLAFDEAKKLCPHLICVHVATYAQGASETEAKYHENPKPETHKVSLDPYRRESVKILKIFAESCPTIEKASIDEAFLDFSIPVRDILCTRYAFPTLEALQDPSSEVSLDDPLPAPPPLDLQDLLNASPSNNHVLPIDPDPELPQTAASWTDIALLIGAELMARCRHQVFDQLGYTCSAGIASNKMLAKLCSAYKKPDAQTVLRPGAVRAFLRPMEVSKVRFLGGKLGQAVADLIVSSSTTSADGSSKECLLSEAWTIPLAQLQSALGEDTGMWVWETVRGVDRTEVEPKTHVKSMMSSKNFRPSISSWNQGLHWLRILARDLFARLNEAREATPGIWPKTIVMHKRDGMQNSMAKQIAFPFTAQLTDEYIFVLGQKLLQELSVRLSDQTFQLGTVTSLALAFQTLERVEAGQRGIQGFFAPQKPAPVGPSTPAADPCPRTRPKSPSQRPAIIRSRSSASLADPKPGSPGNKKPKKGTLDGYIGPLARPPPRAPTPPKASPPRKPKKGTLDGYIGPLARVSPANKAAAPPARASRLTFVCPRCREAVVLDPSGLAHEKDDGEEEEEQRLRFERLKNVHLDHHFAQDLAAQDRPAPPRNHPWPILLVFLPQRPPQETLAKDCRRRGQSHSSRARDHGLL
ncbi:hypothetical protein PTTG_08028 [Puccinia triticina 1-1 BBBD Race 1]|uniref:DNA polymerase eta n=1 Tax=Puccinia triticina (isolate 1-1 / race 1 (BBBD)) TaxID=630390 RepID=A0A180GMF3_PUCT1|nr:hypothetical protein PTTG_08028 [Puccinia triticina 1-1 BBBD Race 1]